MILYLVDGLSCSFGLTCSQVICNWMGKTGLTSNFRGSEIQYYYYHYVGHDGTFCGLKCFIQQTIAQCKQLINKQAVDKLGLPFHAFDNFWKKTHMARFWNFLPVSLEGVFSLRENKTCKTWKYSCGCFNCVVVIFFSFYFLSALQSCNDGLYYCSCFNPGLKAQVKITLSQAQNIFMP